MKHVIENPHINATKTVTITGTKIGKFDAYRVEILDEVYTSQSGMYSDKTITMLLYAEELDGLITALKKAKVSKLLGIK